MATEQRLRLLVLGRGKTGALVAEVARERGHSVTAIGSDTDIRTLDEPFDAAIDFTTPQAVVPNLRVLLGRRMRVVVGATGWYQSLDAMAALARESRAGLLHGTNFSLGVQAFFRAASELASSLPGYELRIEETHHITKKDAPSGTALTLRHIVERAGGTRAEVESHRIGDAAGLHVLTLRSPEETLTLQHEARSRRSFAVGAVRAAEWLVRQPAGVYDFAEVAPLL